MKLHPRLISSAAAALAILSIAACSVPQAKDAAAAPAAPAACRQDAAAALTGKSRISDADARQATGASIVRQIQPGQPVTMDYRRERVTIETDAASGKIVRAYCG
ncbi:hypothetical protein EJP67_19000 [Variovorax guangxiensis]|uniref:Lipoprotein-anchoring transpeptidase ErfK/SrfK n=1 Tax=Variovorax guangxiensis TaxID=1775474 RepID=A0A433MMT5_9BURK|nr:I78 family peptidase inhibitor [Variovorax guangxiensis]MBB4223967.1 lipoprotein-anchoring transpeptidase ErfK/SrfK [Variovorax guangxiensis]RUR69148.1 hypothetical protein EJP67_19000 [Variovorax guangxiensis]